MNNMLIKSQDENFTGFCKYIAIGQRQPRGLIGDKLKKLLYESKVTEEQLVEMMGNSYRNTIERILKNEEIPKREFVQKIAKKLEVDITYFNEDNLQNVIVTDGNIVVGTYKTDEKAIEVKNQLDNIVIECFRNNKPVVLEIPKEKE